MKQYLDRKDGTMRIDIHSILRRFIMYDLNKILTILIGVNMDRQEYNYKIFKLSVFKDKAEKIAFLSFILMPSLIPILYLWGWLCPVGFIQRLIMLIVSIIFYIPLTIAWYMLLCWLFD